MLGKLVRIRDYYAQFPFVRRCAIQFGGPAKDNDVATVAANLVNFVKTRMRYIPDPFGFEFVTAPDVQLAEILKSGITYGDCDDHVTLLNTLLCSVGFDTHFVAVKLPPAGELFDHVVSSVNVNGSWFIVDPCAKGVVAPQYLEQHHVG